MRTDVYAVDETVEIEEKEAERETPAFHPSLHEAPAAPKLTDEDLREIKRRHLAFKQIGRNQDVDAPPTTGLVPLPLYPYLEVDRLRGDYPVCVFKEASAGVASLTKVVDRAVDELGLEGDDLERCRRRAYQLESRIRQRLRDERGGHLFKLWNTCSEELSNQHKDDPEKQERLHDDLAAVRKHLPSDAALIDCGASTAPILLDALARENREQVSAATQSVADVVQRLKDLLSLEFEESDTGLAADHLKEAVGDAFQSDLDFDALSALLQDAPHGESLSANRRARIEAIIGVLDGHLDLLRNRKETIKQVPDAGQLTQHIDRLLQDDSLVARTWLAARLEVGNRFDEKRHGALLMPDGPARWRDVAHTPTPLPPIQIDLRDGFTASDTASLAELFDRQVPVRVLVTVGNCVAGGGSEQSEPYLPVSLGERIVAAGQPSGYICQRSLANVDGLLQALRDFLRSEGTAVMIVYDGANFGFEGMHPYLKSAAGTESRTVPAFVSDGGKGETWVQRFSVTDNEQAERVWPEIAVESRGDDGSVSARPSVFSAASLMLCDPKFEYHFAQIERREWHDDLTPIEKYRGGAQEIPFVEAASEDGTIQRVIASDYVWRQTLRVAQRWKSLRELGGFDNSFAAKAVKDEKARLENEFEARVRALEEQHNTTLKETTGRLAQDIVANIAAGLLGDASLGAPLPRTKPAPPTKTAEAAEEERPTEPDTAVEEPSAEEEELEVFDEAYVETPRCTACDECTTLNPRMFVYNENKQAYIADASAGTYRELVLAAEKCPVRIIHPGKPLNPDEPHLDELIKRAEPFR